MLDLGREPHFPRDPCYEFLGASMILEMISINIIYGAEDLFNGLFKRSGPLKTELIGFTIGILQ